MLVAEIAAGVELASAAARKPADTAASETRNAIIRNNTQKSLTHHQPHTCLLCSFFSHWQQNQKLKKLLINERAVFY